MASGFAKPRVAILISGTGSNMEAIIKACRDGRLVADPVVVVSDNPGAPGLKTASRFLVESFACPYRRGAPREENEAPVTALIKEHGADWIVLAGFMRILSPNFVRAFPRRIVNVHPALLPAFPGGHAIRDALQASADYTGVTIHIVDEFVDHGPILAQVEVPIYPDDTEDSLAARIHAAEHDLYPRTLQQLFFEDV
ncbi:MAG: phosphoribosylglycinamide formyltransferase [Synergistaceae bacterium]|jgi:formyltetrahydrofolate-dependent phosphoribosylglycinamide formyltransferase|nr:phosphoribosylglycinamide formyltransferase [Synergistaceae bacterium]